MYVICEKAAVQNFVLATGKINKLSYHRRLLRLEQRSAECRIGLVGSALLRARLQHTANASSQYDDRFKTSFVIFDIRALMPG